jgi:hypothetical protein
MMESLKRSGLVWALLLCLVLVNGFMAVPSAAHAEHHSNHRADTHTTGICAWLCAAGQGIETSWVQPASSLQLLERATVTLFDEVHDAISPYTFLRGPPAFSQ